MTTNAYFPHGVNTEQNLVESLIIESLQMYGQDLYYIPRTLVAEDKILGEDRLSEFKHSYPIEMYLQSADFQGAGHFIDKFGLMIDQSATLLVSRLRWNQLVGSTGNTIIPNRPNEGDLIYYPLADSMFQIQYVEYQNPFYQLGKLYMYALSVELFRYSSERLSTGVPAIDVFQSLKTFDVDPTVSDFGVVSALTIASPGSGYTTATVTITGDGTGATATAIVAGGKVASLAITNPGIGYKTATVTITGDGTGATATVTLATDIDKPDGYGENTQFLDQAKGLVFNTSNPFGDVE